MIVMAVPRNEKLVEDFVNELINKKKRQFVTNELYDYALKTRRRSADGTKALSAFLFHSQERLGIRVKRTNGRNVWEVVSDA